jgi:hypothetical protein
MRREMSGDATESCCALGRAIVSLLLEQSERTEAFLRGFRQEAQGTRLEDATRPFCEAVALLVDTERGVE